MNKKGMFISSKRPPQIKKSISYGGWESEKLNKMEKELMEHYGTLCLGAHLALLRRSIWNPRALNAGWLWAGYSGHTVGIVDARHICESISA